MKGGWLISAGKRSIFLTICLGTEINILKKLSGSGLSLYVLGLLSKEKISKKKISLCTDNIFPFLRNAVQKEN